MGGVTVVELCEQMKAAIANLDQSRALELANSAVDRGLSPLKAVEAFASGLRIVGDQFEREEVFLPELIWGAEIMKSVMAVLEPRLQQQEGRSAQAVTIVLGTVQGDIHNIGKNIVSTMLSVSGFRVVDLGVDVPDDKFIERAQDEKAQIIGMAAFMSTTRPHLGSILLRLQELGLRDRFKVMVGGAAVNRAYAQEIGADGYGENAVEAVTVAETLVAGAM